MRLLYVTDALAIHGGVERVLTQKVNWFADYGCEVCVVTVNQSNKPLSFPIHSNVQYFDLDILYYKQYDYSGWKRLKTRYELNRLFKNRLAGRIRNFSPDIIVCAYLEYLDKIISIKGDIPLVFESHSSCLCESFENDGILRKLYLYYEKLCLKKTEMVVTLTNGDAQEWRKYTSRVCVIPNIVSLNTSNELSNCSAKSVIFVGRFTKQKDYPSLLKIWSIVHQKFPEWQLHIYGGYGDEMKAWLTEIRQLNFNIIVHDVSSDMLDRYKENSILLLTSKYEPFGLVLPEAMSCGIPVVAFDCPYGPADIISDGVDGFLIKNRDINDFSDKVCLLIENEDMRIKMGKAGRMSSQRYRENIIMPRWVQLFSQLCN